MVAVGAEKKVGSLELGSRGLGCENWHWKRQAEHSVFSFSFLSQMWILRAVESPWKLHKQEVREFNFKGHQLSGYEYDS